MELKYRAYRRIELIQMFNERAGSYYHDGK